MRVRLRVRVRVRVRLRVWLRLRLSLTQAQEEPGIAATAFLKMTLPDDHGTGLRDALLLQFSSEPERDAWIRTIRQACG